MKHPSVVRPGDPEPPVGTVLALKRLRFTHEDCGPEGARWQRSSSPEAWMTWAEVGQYIAKVHEWRLIPVAAASVVKWGTA